MKPGPIIVVGSVNIDMMLRCPHLPRAGETVMGREFAIAPGGKGANQAVAAARMGAEVVFLGAVGDDAFSATALRSLADEGIDVRSVRRISAESTGVAMVLSDAAGENCIALAPGANARLGARDVDAAARAFDGAAMLLCQLESPLETVERAIDSASRRGIPVLLNPAPASPVPAAWFARVDLLVPNAVEAAALCGGGSITGVQEAIDASAHLQGLGARRVIVTLGAQGVVVAAGERRQHFSAPAVQALDTTGAGDTFVGALAASLVRKLPLEQAVALAQQAAALSVTRRGAQAGMPRLADLNLDAAAQSARELSAALAPDGPPGAAAAFDLGIRAVTSRR